MIIWHELAIQALQELAECQRERDKYKIELENLRAASLIEPQFFPAKYPPVSG